MNSDTGDKRIGANEGDPCGMDGCEGVIEVATPYHCCGTHVPCEQCERLECSVCERIVGEVTQ